MPLIGEYGFPVIDNDGYKRLNTDAGIYQDAGNSIQ